MSNFFENITVYAICAIMSFCTGCSGEQDKVPAIHKEGEVMLRVIEDIFNNGWKTAGTIVVKHDGSYQWTIHKATSTSENVEGHLSRSLMRALQEDILQKRGFEVIERVPTYQYGIDNHRVHHPSGIGQLLTFVREKYEGTKNIGDGGCPCPATLDCRNGEVCCPTEVGRKVNKEPVDRGFSERVFAEFAIVP